MHRTRPNHSFLDVAAFGPDGELLHDRGASAEPGLYFLGLEFQYALASGTIQGMDRDARYLCAACAGTGRDVPPVSHGSQHWRNRGTCQSHPAD